MFLERLDLSPYFTRTTTTIKKMRQHFLIAISNKLNSLIPKFVNRRIFRVIHKYKCMFDIRYKIFYEQSFFKGVLHLFKNI